MNRRLEALDAELRKPCRQSRSKAKTSDAVDPLNRLIVSVRQTMRDHPAAALDYRNALWSIGLDRLDRAETKREQSKIRAALNAIDAAYLRHIETYREPATAAAREAA